MLGGGIRLEQSCVCTPFGKGDFGVQVLQEEQVVGGPCGAGQEEGGPYGSGQGGEAFEGLGTHS